MMPERIDRIAEPNRHGRRVRNVHGPATTDHAAGGDTGEQPVAVARQIDVPGEPARVYDLESTLTVEVDGADFHDFWVESRDGVGRALALTLRDADLASEAVDEGMIRAYQRWDTVRELDNPGGWVYRVGLNYARSRVRRLSRKLTRHTPPPVEPSTYEPSIVRALDQLSIDHRSVVVCRLLLDWSEAETAAALRVRPGTVKSRLSRALAQLEQHLAHLRPPDTSPSTEKDPS